MIRRRIYRVIILLLSFGVIEVTQCYASVSNVKQDGLMLHPETPYQLIHTLKDSNGAILGEVLVKYKVKGVFEQMLILRKNNEGIDTLYSINKTILTNPKGVDIKVSPRAFWGYKVVLKRNEYIILTMVNNKKVGISDDIMISWSHEKKMFEILKTP